MTSFAGGGKKANVYFRNKWTEIADGLTTLTKDGKAERKYYPLL